MNRVGVHDDWFVDQFRNGIISINEDFRVYRVVDEIIIDRLSNDGYYQIFLWDIWEQKIKTMFSHRLVWMVFNFQYIPDGLIINHSNGIKNNNHPFNLELSTYSWNNSHAHLLQLNSSKGENNSRAYFTNEQVCEIRKFFATNAVTVTFMAKRFDTIWMTMKLILNGQSYREVISGYEEECKRKFL